MSDAAVLHFDQVRVADAFARGEPIFTGNTDVNCGVNPSRRSEPGEVEVHARDADVMYFLEGSATMVTGGTVIGRREIAPGETRGERIEGGVTRQLAAGEVLIIPAGVPHWFKDVNGTLQYYVVKIRSSPA